MYITPQKVPSEKKRSVTIGLLFYVFIARNYVRFYSLSMNTKWETAQFNIVLTN